MRSCTTPDRHEASAEWQSVAGPVRENKQMIILIGLMGIMFIAAGLAVFIIKKNKKLSLTFALSGLICFLLSVVMLFAILHFGEAPRDSAKIQTMR